MYTQLSRDWDVFWQEKPEIIALREEAIVLREETKRYEEAAILIRKRREREEVKMQREAERRARKRIKHLPSVKDLLRDVGIED